MVCGPIECSPDVPRLPAPFALRSKGVSRINRLTANGYRYVLTDTPVGRSWTRPASLLRRRVPRCPDRRCSRSPFRDRSSGPPQSSCTSFVYTRIRPPAGMTIAGNVNVGPSSDTSTRRQPFRSRSVSPVLTISTYSSGSCLDATPSKKMQEITTPPSSLGGVGLDVGVSVGAGVGVGRVGRDSRGLCRRCRCG